jgi:hypothetical protein
MFDKIEDRLKALAVATNASVVQDYSKVPAHGSVDEQRIVFMSRVPVQELTPVEAKLRVVLALDMIYSVKDNLKALVRGQGTKDQIVEDFVKTSFPLQVTIDLHNAHKHGGYPQGYRGHSKRAPQLTNVRKTLRLSSGPVAHSGASITLTSAGPMAGMQRSGSVAIVIAGTISDDAGGQIGDITDFLDKATADWERFAAGLGISVEKSPEPDPGEPARIDPKAQEAVDAALDAGEDFVLHADEARRKIYVGYRSGPGFRTLEWPVEAALPLGNTILAAARANAADEFQLDDDLWGMVMPTPKAIEFFAKFVELCLRVSGDTQSPPVTS